MATGAMRKVTRWWWVRHAPAIGHDGRIYGQTDVACDCTDTATFAALARILPEDAVWVATPMRRTKDTAAAIRAAGNRGQEPIIEPDLIEQNFGGWQGRKRSEIIRHRLWISGADEMPPGGESFVDVMARVRAAIERLNEAHRGRDIVAVAHGGTIRSALGLALDLEPERALAFHTDNLALTVIERFTEPGMSHDWRVVTVNRPALGFRDGDSPLA